MLPNLPSKVSIQGWRRISCSWKDQATPTNAKNVNLNWFCDGQEIVGHNFNKDNIIYLFIFLYKVSRRLNEFTNVLAYSIFILSYKKAPISPSLPYVPAGFPH